LEHSAGLLAKRGWNVVFLGVETAHGFELPPAPRVKSYRMKFIKGGWAQKLQYLAFFVWTLGWTLRWQPKWIYASDPLSCPVAWWVRKLTGVRVLYHEHDSPAVANGGKWFMRRVLQYRRKLARDAEVCVVPQQERLRKFQENTGRTKHTFCVWNCPSLDEYNRLSSPRERDKSDNCQQIIAYYHGSINPDRLPMALVAGASRFGGTVRLRIAGYETLGGAGYIRRMVEFAESNGAKDMIEHLGTLPRRKDVLDAASSADVGIALMPKECDDINMQHMVGASNKPFDYMACGLPLLVSTSAEWIETFVKPGYARACDPADPNSIEAALWWYLEHAVDRRKMGQRASDHIGAAWNYEEVFTPVLAALESC
jgi:glycosyltransferase involved in cell wall biosynthesis